MRTYLEDLRAVLVSAGDSYCAGIVSDALASDEHAVRVFLLSNELWGGSGSIADQGGMEVRRDDTRRTIEAALIRLGEAQVREGVVNSRTATWVRVFQSWQRQGI
jgi:hypothetical protein